MNEASGWEKQGRQGVAGMIERFPDGSAAITLGPRRTAPDDFALSADEVDRFLRIVARASGIRRHYELFQLLQGEVQYFIPHQILVSAWGDFRGSNLTLDVVSDLPGVRTGRLDGCPIDSALKGLHARWLAQGREAVLLDQAAITGLVQRRCDCALHRSLRGMRSAVVHGSHDARHGTYSLYLASSANSIVREGGIERFRFLVDSVMAQIEVAFRRVGGLRSPSALSAREEEILAWVSEGRTNHQIAQILAISSFTVKNHIHRIIKKLGVANRTEAVARYRQRGGSWRSKGVEGTAVSLVE